MLKVLKATRADAEFIGSAPDLRKADREEIFAATGSVPELVVPMSFDVSDECYVLVEDWGDAHGVSNPIAIFGVGVAPPTIVGGIELRVGTIWLIGLDSVVAPRNRRSFLRLSRLWVNKLGEPYDALCNLVYAKNTVHLTWLKWCGFLIGDPRPYGPNGALFHPFVKRFLKD